MNTVIGFYRISLESEADTDAFEKVMQEDVFPDVRVGQPTRGGTVTAQYLLRRRASGSGHEYTWLVEWTEEGGSPFGREGTPGDPRDALARFGARTAYEEFAVVAGQRS